MKWIKWKWENADHLCTKFSLVAGGHFSSRSHCSHVDCMYVLESCGACMAFYVFYVAMQIRPSTVSANENRRRSNDFISIHLDQLSPRSFFGSKPIYSSSGASCKMLFNPSCLTPVDPFPYPICFQQPILATTGGSWHYYYYRRMRNLRCRQPIAFRSASLWVNEMDPA